MIINSSTGALEVTQNGKLNHRPRSKRGPYAKRSNVHPDGEKICNGACAQVLPYSQFFRDKTRRDGYTAQCKVCHQDKLAVAIKDDGLCPLTKIECDKGCTGQCAVAKEYKKVEKKEDVALHYIRKRRDKAKGRDRDRRRRERKKLDKMKREHKATLSHLPIAIEFDLSLPAIETTKTPLGDVPKHMQKKIEEAQASVLDFIYEE